MQYIIFESFGYSLGLAVMNHAEGLLEELQRRAEEAELTAAVQTRRVSSAETELSDLRSRLSDAEQQVKDLSWQVRMSLSSGDGTRGRGGGNTAVGMFDIFGCGANSKR